MFFTDDQDNLRFVVFYSVCTCIYFMFILAFVFLKGITYNIGKFSFIQVIAVLIVAEIAKFIVGIKIYGKPIAYIGKIDSQSSTFAATFKKYWNKNKIRDVFKCLLSVACMIFVYYCMFVLFGAELFSKHEETFMLSLLLCVLTVIPACLQLGTQSFWKFALGMKPKDLLGIMVYRNLQFTLVGTWFGAFVIPLDWDRPWQEWPIPCAYGSIFGFCLCNVLVASYAGYKYFRKNIGKKGRKIH